MALRHSAPLVVVDLAVPRNVEPVPDTLPGLTTLDLDALPGHGRERLSVGFEAARETVAAETASYLAARAARQAGDLLGAVTARAGRMHARRASTGACPRPSAHSSRR